MLFYILGYAPGVLLAITTLLSNLLQVISYKQVQGEIQSIGNGKHCERKGTDLDGCGR